MCLILLLGLWAFVGLDVHQDFDHPLKVNCLRGKTDTYLKKWVNSRAEIVANKASYFGVAEGMDEEDDVADKVQGAEVRGVDGSTRRGRATIAALVECDDVVAG
jgi:hypothetical protein